MEGRDKVLGGHTGGRVLATDEQLSPQGSSFDWQIWQPSTDRDQELQTDF